MKKKIFIIIPVVIILVFLIYKAGLILYYKDNSKYSVNFTKIKIDSKNIKIKKELSNTKFETLNIYIPDTFKKTTSEYSTETSYYIPNDENKKNFSSMIYLREGRSCYEMEYDENKVLQTMGIDKLLKKNNIENEFELIDYYYKKRKNNSLFSLKNDVKMNYLSDNCVKNSILNINRADYYYVKGDLEGLLVISENNNSYSLKIYDNKNDKYYNISLDRLVKKNNYKEILTDDEINKVINSIYFD